MNAKQRREAAMAALPVAGANPLSIEEARKMADAHAALAPLGRTTRWQEACRAAHEELDRGSDPTWSIVQTRVWMAWAL